MIDERSLDRFGWARFSDDRVFRYRLGRALTPAGLDWLIARGEITAEGRLVQRITRVVFVMLNPSTADAFKLDPTVRKCCQFAQLWGADLLEVVNLFAMRSPYPSDLLTRPRGQRGDDADNDRAILDACCTWPDTRVIAAWGNHGTLDGRAEYVRGLFRERHVEVEHLGTTDHGNPLHPLARGKSFIPLSRMPVAWP